ncbi:MAG TPA: glycosyltransferase [Methanofastidiosum sp.]|nr:glycosyltransferase [Methanofastidiosum sp.]
MKIVLATTNDLIYDSRINKIAESLSKKHDVVLICLNEKGNFDTSGYPYKIIFIRDSKLKTKTKDIRRKLKNKLGKFSIFAKDISIYLLEKKSAYELEAKLIEENADIYVAVNLNTLSTVYKVAKSKNKLIVYEAQELSVDQYSNSFIGKIIWKIEENIYIKNVDAIITTNIQRAKILKERYNLLEMPYIIHNIPKLNKKKINVNGISDPIKLLYSGIYTELRGLEQIVASMEYVSDNFELHLLGHGNLETRLLEIIKEKNIENKVIFHDPVPYNQVVNEISKYDIGIVTYLPTNLNNYYCSPNKLYEYIQAGLGIISINLPEPEEVIAKYHNGILFNSYEPLEIANTINTIQREDILKFKKNSIMARSNLCWENEEIILLSIFDKINDSIKISK